MQLVANKARALALVPSVCFDQSNSPALFDRIGKRPEKKLRGGLVGLREREPRVSFFELSSLSEFFELSSLSF